MPDDLRRSSPKEYISPAVEGIWEVEGLGYFAFQGFGECLGIPGSGAYLQLYNFSNGWRGLGSKDFLWTNRPWSFPRCGLSFGSFLK